MAVSQLKSVRRPSGGKYKQKGRKKKAYELGRDPAFTKLDKRRIKDVRTKGDHRKIVLLSTDTANLFDPKAKKYEQVKIKTIVENPANRHFIRRNIITKGSVIETEIGKASCRERV